MKHSFKITILLLILFLLAQFLGLGILNQYIDQEKTLAEGKTIFKELPIGERPPLEEKTSYFPVIMAILIGTGFLWLLIKYKLIWLWKFWFLIAVIISLAIAFSALIKPEIAFILALILGFWKIFKPNFWVQNLTELFVYGGLAAIFVPLFSLWSVIILLILISIYDAYAVWKSKHMIVLAKSQSKAGMFAGLVLPYQITKSIPQKIKTKIKTSKVRTAILGGGDLGFPLIFAGVILKEFGLWQALLIPLFAMIGLAVLFWKAEEKKFYPAMPFIAAGCFLGLGVVWVIQLLFLRF
ncbi:MAG TPA: presenilin family intramembrane aspartyl protease [Candidatus Nanoarchaeia archaeon]|nr:presenilin family intramembrane aspartyl protease [Candidatus Nanoarchaeia archaeon]